MTHRRTINNHQVRSYQSNNREPDGIPPKKPEGNWLSRTLKSWKGKTTEFLKKHQILPDKPIYDRLIDDNEEQKRQAEIHQYLLENPCEYALRSIDEEKAIAGNFIKEALKPGLRMTWEKTANIPAEQADKMIDLLIDSFELKGLDVNQEYLDSYQHASRYSPLSPSDKYNLIIKLNEQLKTPAAQQNFGKMADALEHYRKALYQQGQPINEVQHLMENLAEYLINYADNLPPLTYKGLAACAHFSKYIESAQYEAKDIPTEMARFMDYMAKNPESFTSMTPNGIAGSYIFSAEFEDQKEHLPGDVLRPSGPDNGLS